MKIVTINDGPRLMASPRHSGKEVFLVFHSLIRRTGSPAGGGGVYRNPRIEMIIIPTPYLNGLIFMGNHF